MKQSLSLGLLTLLLVNFTLICDANAARSYNSTEYESDDEAYKSDSEAYKSDDEDIASEDYYHSLSQEQLYDFFKKCIQLNPSQENLSSFFAGERTNHTSRNCHILGGELFFHNVNVAMQPLTMSQLITALKKDTAHSHRPRVGYFVLPPYLNDQGYAKFLDEIMKGLDRDSLRKQYFIKEEESGFSFTFKSEYSSFKCIAFNKNTEQFLPTYSIRFYFDKNGIFQSCYPASPGKSNLNRGDALATLQIAYPNLQWDHAPQANDMEEERMPLQIIPQTSLDDLSPTIRNGNSNYNSWEDAADLYQ